jgi:hypothetical protein
MEHTLLKVVLGCKRVFCGFFVLVLVFFAANSFYLTAHAAIACDPSVQLIANGDFETPIVTNPDKWDIFADGTAGLGWHVDWVSNAVTTFNGHVRPEPAVIELEQVNHLGWLPSHGAQYAELDTDWQGPNILPTIAAPASVKISQDILTVPGDTYQLSFDFSPRPDTIGTAENVLNIAWNGAALDTLTAQNTNGNTQTQWASHSYTLTAASTTSHLEFSDGGIPDSVGTFLDNISFVCASSALGGGSGTSTATSTATSTGTTTATSTTPITGGGGSSTTTPPVTGGGSSATSTATSASTGTAPIIISSSGSNGSGHFAGVSSGNVVGPIASTGGSVGGSAQATQGEVLGASTGPGMPNTGGGDALRTFVFMFLVFGTLSESIVAIVRRKTNAY